MNITFYYIGVAEYANQLMRNCYFVPNLNLLIQVLNDFFLKMD